MDLESDILLPFALEDKVNITSAFFDRGSQKLVERKLANAKNQKSKQKANIIILIDAFSGYLKVIQIKTTARLASDS